MVVGGADNEHMDGFSNAVVAVILDTVRDLAGDDGVATVLAEADERRSLRELTDVDGWSSGEQMLALARAGVSVTGTSDLVRRAGVRAFDPASGNPLPALLATLPGPAEAFLFTSDHFDLRCTLGELSCDELGADRAVVTLRMRPAAATDPVACDYLAGVFATIPTIFGRPPATVVERQCQAAGAPACRFEVCWAPDAPPAVAPAAADPSVPHDAVLGAMLGFAADCTDPADGATVAAGLAATVPAVTGGSRAVVLRWIEDEDRLDEAARSGGGPRAVAGPAGVAACRQFVTRLAARGRPLSLRVRPTEPVVDDLCRLAGFERGLVVPLMAHGACHGVLLVDRELRGADGAAGGAPEAALSRLVASADMAAAALARLELRERATRQAMLDPLTGLADTALLQLLAEPVLARTARGGDPGALLVVDVDGLAVVNEHFGRSAGDRVLRAAADRLQAAVRAGDSVARIGDDEFAVLLSLPGLAGAEEVAARAVAACAVPVSLDGAQVRVSVSVGVARCGPGDRFDDLLTRAERALGQAKAAGPGRVAHAA